MTSAFRATPAIVDAAYQQYSGGQVRPADVPRMGWPLGTQFVYGGRTLSEICTVLRRMWLAHVDGYEIDNTAIPETFDFSPIIWRGFDRKVSAYLDTCGLTRESFLAVLQERTSPRVAQFDWSWLGEEEK